MKRHEYQEFQAAFKTAILSGNITEPLHQQLVESAGLTAHQRVQVHYNNFRETLSGSLSGMFPAFEVFVGAAFVSGALKEYCVASPPTDASLAEYGAGFADFLEGHKATENLAYIPDLIRLEWSIHSLQLVDEFIYPATDIGQSLADTLSLGLSTNARLVESEFPLMSLWSAAVGQIPPKAVHLDQGGQTVVIILKDGQVSLTALDRAERDVLAHVLADKTLGDARHKQNPDSIIKKLLEKSILVEGQH
jgi:hypothetical protein